MLTAIREVGRLLLQKENPSHIDILLEDPDSNGKYNKALIIDFDGEQNFIGVTVEDLLKENYKIYLYRRGNGSSPDYSPTSRLTAVEKTFPRKICGWFKNYPKFEKLHSQLEKNKAFIMSELKRLSALNEKDNKIITVRINGKLPYQNKEIRELFEEKILKELKKYTKKNAKCSICGEKKEEVFSTTNLYKFYVLDKASYIPGFNKKNSWKNFPLCKECYIETLHGKKFIENNLTFKLFRKEYLLIPKVIVPREEVLKELLEILEDAAKNIQLNENSQMDREEEEILEIFKDRSDSITFYFLFFKGGDKGDKEKVTLLVEDVLPSRITKVLKAKERVEEIFSDKYYQKYTLKKLEIFLNQYDNLIYEITDKIFRGGRLSFQSLLQILNKKIRESLYISEKKFKSCVRDSLMNIIFLEYLGLINTEEVEEMNSQLSDKVFEKVFQKIGKSLNTPSKKGVFLLGCLTQYLLNNQSGNKPFTRQLKGLKMNEMDIRGLLPKVINKLIEYDKYNSTAQIIATKASEYLLKEERFQMTTNELNFYFSAGMALYSETKDAIFQIVDQLAQQEQLDEGEQLPEYSEYSAPPLASQPSAHKSNPTLTTELPLASQPSTHESNPTLTTEPTLAILPSNHESNPTFATDPPQAILPSTHKSNPTLPPEPTLASQPSNHESNPTLTAEPTLASQPSNHESNPTLPFKFTAGDESIDGFKLSEAPLPEKFEFTAGDESIDGSELSEPSPKDSPQKYFTPKQDESNKN